MKRFITTFLTLAVCTIIAFSSSIPNPPSAGNPITPQPSSSDSQDTPDNPSPSPEQEDVHSSENDCA